MIKYCHDCGIKNSPKGTYCKKCGYKHRQRPSGLKYKISQQNKGWFKKSFIPHNKGKSKAYLDKSQGYYRIKINGKDIRLHRYIVEKHIDRSLLESELVHHIDGNKLNNSIENLIVISRKQHMQLHWAERRENII